MKPYYQDSAVTIYHGDCREVVPTLGRFDLLLTDPPYGIGYVHGEGGGCSARSTSFSGVAVYGDDKPFIPAEWLGFPLVVLWGANHYADKLPTSRGWLVWDKRGGMKSNDQSDVELAWTNFLTAARMRTQVWNGMITSGEQRGKPRVHPTQKPVELMAWCIGLAGENVATILDPFAGSGTTGRAAKDLGRKAVLIEREEKYCEIAARRMGQEVLCFDNLNPAGQDRSPPGERSLHGVVRLGNQKEESQ